MAFSLSYFWLATGSLLIFLEIMGISGVGLFFLGFASLCVGVCVHLGWISEISLIFQIVSFIGFSALLIPLLWIPFKQKRDRHSREYNDVIGQMGTVQGDLKKGETGQVRWSGTTMLARCEDRISEPVLLDGTKVKIIDVIGNQLIVQPEKNN